jgi:hypothetical protein
VIRLALLALAATFATAEAAELPTRLSKPKPHDKAPACEIAGEPGAALPGGGCIKIGGVINVGVGAGWVKR